MKKRWIAMILAVIFAVSITSTASYSQQEKTADALNELDLFRGKGAAGYDLEANLTRAEGATLLVRVLGKDAEAADWPLDKIPFKDVPAWAIGYVGYAYANGITNGTNLEKGEFSPNAPLSDFMFLTLVLRALGHSDQGTDPAFVWNNPYALAAQVGLISRAKADNDFTRGDAVEVLWNAMGIELVGKNMTLAQSLIRQGVFSRADFETAEEIHENGRTENAGTPVERPNSNNNNNTGGSGSGNQNSNDQSGSNENKPLSKLPWENGGKKPENYTWTEYVALSDAEQNAFREYFDSIEKFGAWLDKTLGDGSDSINVERPWENGGKQPVDYTWAEFQNLNENLLIIFQNWFAENNMEFTDWLNREQGNASGSGEETRWEGSKLPTEYTWTEFQSLNANEQLAFQKWFGSTSAFERWMEEAKATEEEDDNNWEGSKLPTEYTWAEFEDLSGEDQLAFQNWFGSSSAFERWMENAQAAEEDNQWSGDKSPNEYTWAEFEDLSGEDQLAFQNWFGSMSAFEAWMEDARAAEEEDDNSWEGSKLPTEYTWAEFEDLSPEDQMAFQNWFDSIDDFVEWMESAIG